MNPEQSITSRFFESLSNFKTGTCLLILIVAYSPATLAQTEISFTSDQVITGKALYQEHCQICHGTRLSNGQFGTPLKGSYFRNNWAGKSVGELLTFTYESMPPDNKKALPPQQYAEILAFIFEKNKFETSDTPISGDFEALNLIMLPW